MEMNLDELLMALRELKFGVDEAKNLCFNGKIVQCDRKLQGCQVRLDNIMMNVANARMNPDEVVDDSDSTSEG